MSKRPTTINRKECTITSNNNNHGYIIIGDTSAATLYARRLLGNHVTADIKIISEGSDNTNIENIHDLTFIVNNNNCILHHLTTEKIHMIPSVSNDCEGDYVANTQKERIIQYHVGRGTLGDFISAYHIPRLGPWFTHSSNGRLEKFFADSTVRSELNSAESIVVDRLRKIWGLTITNNVITKTPSILNVHYEFIERKEDMYTREIFYDKYELTNSSENVDYITETREIKFAESSGLYNITINGTEYKGVTPVWKTNPYTYLRLSSEGGLNIEPVNLSTMYRAVLSIPLNGSVTSNPPGNIILSQPGYVCYQNGNVKTCYNGLQGLEGINLSGIDLTEDLLTTHITFSLHDINNPKHNSIAWLLQAYTTPEDLSVVHPDGKYSDSNYTLLIVEGISLKNKRRASYNITDREIYINYNEAKIENNYLRQFGEIVASVYNAYTGGLISVDDLVSDISVCSPNSKTCHDGSPIVDYSLRESPMVSILQLTSDLYGSDIYPSVPKC